VIQHCITFSTSHIPSHIAKEAMDALTQQVRDLYTQTDEQGRKKIQDDLRDLQTSLDSEWDVFVRLASLVSGMNLLHLKHVT
jgi:hypothetical protein